MAADLGCTVNDLVRGPARRQAIKSEKYVTEIDLPRKRIALSMKANPEIGPAKSGDRTSPAAPRGAAPRPPARQASPPPRDWFTEALVKGKNREN